jgi:hypothetical protein
MVAASTASSGVAGACSRRVSRARLAALEGDGGAGPKRAVENEGEVAGGVGASRLGGHLVAQVSDRGLGGMDDLSEDVDLDHAADLDGEHTPGGGCFRPRTGLACGAARARSATLEEVGEFGALPGGEAGERFTGSDAAVGEGAVGTGGADPG